MGKIIWTDRARFDLQEIVEYISRDSKAYARSFALRLRQRVGPLENFPESGAVIPENPQGSIRRIVVGNYRILYRTVPEGCLILTLVHGARRLDSPPSTP